MASLLSAGSDADSFSALISQLFSHATKNSAKLEMGTVRRMLVTASRGCFSAICLGNAWLVAELELEIDPGTVELEIESAAGRLRRQLKLRATEPAASAPLPSATALPRPAELPTATETSAAPPAARPPVVPPMPAIAPPTAHADSDAPSKGKKPSSLVS
jgi:predicted regulator of Ras-like GTPase activity (Roadblock/LC7/MglB family)